MKRRVLAILLAFTVPSLAEDVSSLPAPWPPPKNPADSPFAKMTCTSYASYRVKDVPVNPTWGDIHPDDFGPRDVKFDYAGIKALNQVPAPGIHPRILCTPDDLTDIRTRLKETRCGTK